jgi:membrane associated rhomboid family serine protease
MFPIGDDNSEISIFPIVNYVLIGINILVFVLLQGLGNNDAFTYAFSLVPREITTGVDLQGMIPVIDSVTGKVLGNIPLQHTPSIYLTLLSSMFMHGGFMHIAGNMLFLWIFGDNIENRIGHVRYLAFYLICGLIAAGGQIVMDTNSVIPMLGASGAISGVMGGYLLLFPNKNVRALIFNFLTVIPAYVAVGLWIGLQIFQTVFSNGGDGVAYAAHIGGFFGGLILISLFALGTNGGGGKYLPPSYSNR